MASKPGGLSHEEGLKRIAGIQRRLECGEIPEAAAREAIQQVLAGMKRRMRIHSLLMLVLCAAVLATVFVVRRAHA